MIAEGVEVAKSPLALLQVALNDEVALVSM